MREDINALGLSAQDANVKRCTPLFMPEENKEIVIVDDKTIQEKIYFIRGQKVMLDADLAEIYGYETKNFNRQVKNNIEKFEGEDFMLGWLKVPTKCLYRTRYLHDYDGIKR